MDEWIDEVGDPENMAEITGWKGRVVHSSDGFQYEWRLDENISLEALYYIENRRFMEGEKDVAIISEAPSSVISHYSDRREKNKKSRVHSTL